MADQRDARPTTSAGSSPTATRGRLSERAWADVRRAARLAREEGVQLTMHGISINDCESRGSGVHISSPHLGSDRFGQVRTRFSGNLSEPDRVQKCPNPTEPDRPKPLRE